jgi:hypothetical protein
MASGHNLSPLHNFERDSRSQQFVWDASSEERTSRYADDRAGTDLTIGPSMELDAEQLGRRWNAKMRPVRTGTQIGCTLATTCVDRKER